MKCARSITIGMCLLIVFNHLEMRQDLQEKHIRYVCIISVLRFLFNIFFSPINIWWPVTVAPAV
jgi:hypothetical protein